MLMGKVQILPLGPKPWAHTFKTDLLVNHLNEHKAIKGKCTTLLILGGPRSILDWKPTGSFWH